MVLRKQPPPRLENLTRWNAASKSTPSSLSSPDRLARLNRIPSEDSVYSPDLNTSPAFDLMSLEEAQRSPRGSTSLPQSSWMEGFREGSTPDRPGAFDKSHPATATDSKGHSVPTVLVADRQPDMADSEWRRPTPEAHEPSTGELQVQLQSNNPFRRPRASHSSQEMPDRKAEGGRDSHATSGSEPRSSRGGYIPMTARLSLLDPQNQDSWAERPVSSSHSSAVYRQPPEGQTLWPQHTRVHSEPPNINLQWGQSNSHAPAVVVQPSDQPRVNPYHYEQPHASLHAAGRLGSDAGANTPSATISSATTATSHELIDLDVPDTLAAETGPHRAASSAYCDEKELPDLPAPEKMPSTDRMPEQQASLPRPSPGISVVDAARQAEQRSETYAIRHVNWVDHTGQLLQSPILVQNQNGPCPLLALINALVLRADPRAAPPILRALQTREQVSLGLLIEALFEELTTCLGHDEEFPDIEALTQFLTMLHTGMNVNPRLTLESRDSVGTFFQTGDLRQYGTFGVPLIHGWLAPWSSSVHTAMARVAQYHEDIQLLHFRRQELEDRAMRGQYLSPKEEQTMEDIHTTQRFVEIENATQLSAFGLMQLKNQLAPGSVSILFRNDHFSTLYKHPQSHHLYTLVTDAGYANHAEVVWESLVDMTSFNAEFLSGDFLPVGHGPSGTSDGPQTTSATSTTTNRAPAREEPESALSAQEQNDADYAYALALQFQEDENARTQAPTSIPQRTSRIRPVPRMENAPNRSSSAARPSLEPDPDDPNAPPPPYEQAANDPSYIPSQSLQSMGSPQRNQYGLREYRPEGASVSTGPNRYKDRNKDCIVM